MTVVGLENDNYFTNNEINVQVESAVYLNPIYMDLTVSGKKLRFYPTFESVNRNVFRFNLSPVVKSLAPIPTFEDAYFVRDTIFGFTFNFKVYNNTSDFEEQEIEKTFILGGRFDRNEPNYVASSLNLTSAPIGKSIYWKEFVNFPELYYDFSLDNGLSIPENPYLMNNEYPCGDFLVFLNQFGSYNIWRFASTEITTSTKSLGSFNNFQVPFTGIPSEGYINDLGVTPKMEIKLKTRVHEEYNELMRHLAVSPDVYYFEQNNINYQFANKLIQKSNKHIKSFRDKMYDYTFSFEFENVLNPSLIW